MDITPIGAFHTLAALIALACAAASFVRSGRIDPRTKIGLAYVMTTLLTAMTSLVIFRHGGFGPGHVLGVLTLIAVGIGLVANRARPERSNPGYVEVAALSSTLLFHLIPGVTETLVRVPLEAPFAQSPTDPALVPIQGLVAGLFFVGLTIELLRLRQTRRSPGALASGVA